MNVVSLRGRVTKDPIIRKTQNGSTTATFSLAVERFYNGKKEADFINCVAFGKRAEVLGNYVHKGDRLGLVGEIRTNKYVNKEGRDAYSTNVVANQIDLIETKKESDERRGAYNQPAYNQPRGYEPINEYGRDEDEDIFDFDDEEFPF